MYSRRILYIIIQDLKFHKMELIYQWGGGGGAGGGGLGSNYIFVHFS